MTLSSMIKEIEIVIEKVYYEWLDKNLEKF